jgi:hypothetical protein
MKISDLVEAVKPTPIVRLYPILKSLGASTNFMLTWSENPDNFRDLDISTLHSDPKVQDALRKKQALAKQTTALGTHPDEEKEINAYIDRGDWHGELALIVINGWIEVQLNARRYDRAKDDDIDVHKDFKYKLSGDFDTIADRIDDKLCRILK